MTPHCKNCKYWERQPPDSYFSRHYPNGRGECSNENFVYTGDKDIPKSIEQHGAWLDYSDTESYAASFRTGPEFGCIHFEEDSPE